MDEALRPVGRAVAPTPIVVAAATLIAVAVAATASPGRRARRPRPGCCGRSPRASGSARRLRPQLKPRSGATSPASPRPAEACRSALPRRLVRVARVCVPASASPVPPSGCRIAPRAAEGIGSAGHGDRGRDHGRFGGGAGLGPARHLHQRGGRPGHGERAGGDPEPGRTPWAAPLRRGRAGHQRAGQRGADPAAAAPDRTEPGPHPGQHLGRCPGSPPSTRCWTRPPAHRPREPGDRHAAIAGHTSMLWPDRIHPSRPAPRSTPASCSPPSRPGCRTLRRRRAVRRSAVRR